MHCRLMIGYFAKAGIIWYMKPLHVDPPGGAFADAELIT